MAVLQLNEPKMRRWTREEYYQMAELGWFVNQRVMLLDGEIVEMPVQKSGHYVSIDKAAKILERIFSVGFWVRTQAPLDLGVNSDPEPDVAVVSGSREDYLASHPTTALLIIEVSDTTLRFDRNRKCSLYACGGITDYWIVNLVDRQLEIRRNPVPDSSQEYGYGYADLTILSLADFATPLAAPQVQIAVADLLP